MDLDAYRDTGDLHINFPSAHIDRVHLEGDDESPCSSLLLNVKNLNVGTTKSPSQVCSSNKYPLHAPPTTYSTLLHFTTP